MWGRRWRLAVLAIWTILAHGRETGSEGGKVTLTPGRNIVPGVETRSDPPAAIRNPSGWREAKDNEEVDGNRPGIAVAEPEMSESGKNSVNNRLASESPDSGHREIELLVGKSEEDTQARETKSGIRKVERGAPVTPPAEEETTRKDEERDGTSRGVSRAKAASVDKDVTVDTSGKEKRRSFSQREGLNKGVGEPRQPGSIKGRLFGTNRGDEERRDPSGAASPELVKIAEKFLTDDPPTTTIKNLVSGVRGIIEPTSAGDLRTRGESSTATTARMISAPGVLRGRDVEEGGSSTRVNDPLQGHRDFAITRGTKGESSADIERCRNCCLPRGAGNCIERRNGGSGSTGSHVGPSSADDLSAGGKGEGKLEGGRRDTETDQEFGATRRETIPELSGKVFLAKACGEIGVSRPDVGGGKQDETTPGRSLIARLGDKYLASKKKRGMRESSSGPQKTRGEATRTIYPGEVVRDEESTLGPSDAEPTFHPVPMPEVAESKEPLLSSIFVSWNETTTMTEGAGQLDRVFTGQEDGDEYYSRIDESTEAAGSEASVFLGEFATPASVTSGLPEQDLLPVAIEGAFRTTENSAEFENSSRSTAALNQWPIKHSAVVEGDLVLGGLMMVHEREDSVTCGPVMPQGGVQALEAMLYTLDRLNSNGGILPGVKIGAHILDDCDKDTYGLEMAVDFIKGESTLSRGSESLSFRFVFRFYQPSDYRGSDVAGFLGAGIRFMVEK
ncbi:uncharacterized protein LOC124293037 [Neodiprion lecontei]|uniref:Uncharacterized protein LOC124293037 n=1 Tax=Neodiprion lecontei TaxID=441921 RepID=A0ABM3FIQ9_NEOLC|nr:uncharacterized protein LOC124293037 [Neodiprion lecontei]